MDDLEAPNHQSEKKGNSGESSLGFNKEQGEDVFGIFLMGGFFDK